MNEDEIDCGPTPDAIEQIGWTALERGMEGAAKGCGSGCYLGCLTLGFAVVAGPLMGFAWALIRNRFTH